MTASALIAALCLAGTAVTPASGVGHARLGPEAISPPADTAEGVAEGVADDVQPSADVPSDPEPGPGDEVPTVEADPVEPPPEVEVPDHDEASPSDEFGDDADEFGDDADEFGDDADEFGDDADEFGDDADEFGDDADDEPWADEFGDDADDGDDEFGSTDDPEAAGYDPVRDSPQGLRATRWIRVGIGTMSVGGALLVGALTMGASDPCNLRWGNSCQQKARNRAALVMGIPAGALLMGGATALGVGLERRRALSVDLQAGRGRVGLSVRGRF